MNTCAFENKKRQTEICVNPVICSGETEPEPESEPESQATSLDKKICCRRRKSIHINHSNKTAISSSDYLLKKKSRNQVKITNTDENISSICPDPVKTSKTNC